MAMVAYDIISNVLTNDATVWNRGITGVRFFGVILLAIAVKVFAANVSEFIKSPGVLNR
jgi:hypothetical protein